LATDTTTSDHHALLGAYVGGAAPGNEQRLAEMTHWLGHAPDYAVAFLNQNSWKDFDSSVSWVLGQWPNHEKLLISVPLIPNGADLGTAASGAYNGHYLAAAETIAAYDPDAVIRVGWEMNGDWFPWKASANPEGYVDAFHQLVDTFRSVSPDFKFDWTPNIGTNSIDPTKLYPGDAYVDTIGLDMNVGKAWFQGKSPDQVWDWLLHQPNGLAWQRDFAAAHDKPMSYPEYAADMNDGEFVARMADWIKHNDVAFHSWWNANDVFNGDLESHPADRQAFIAAWGANSDYWHGG
jgi:Glycosyl hydrolase family 26